MQFPTINLNGTDATSLLSRYVILHQHLTNALRAMEDAAPHGRDYPQGGLNQAVEEMTTRYQSLTEIIRDVSDLMGNIDDQQLIRERRNQLRLNDKSNCSVR